MPRRDLLGSILRPRCIVIPQPMGQSRAFQTKLGNVGALISYLLPRHHNVFPNTFGQENPPPSSTMLVSYLSLKRDFLPSTQGVSSLQVVRCCFSKYFRSITASWIFPARFRQLNLHSRERWLVLNQIHGFYS